MKIKRLLKRSSGYGGEIFLLISLIASLITILTMRKELPTTWNTSSIIGIIILCIVIFKTIAGSLHDLIWKEKRISAMINVQGTIYDPIELTKTAEEEVIYIGTNLIGLVTRKTFFKDVEALIYSSTPKNVTIMLTLPRVIKETAVREATPNLLKTVTLINEFVNRIPAHALDRFKVFFHEGVCSLSMTVVDPNKKNGIIVFNPKFSNDASPGDRIFCIVERWENKEIFDNLFGKIVHMQLTNRMDIHQVIRDLKEILEGNN